MGVDARFDSGGGGEMEEHAGGWHGFPDNDPQVKRGVDDIGQERSWRTHICSNRDDYRLQANRCYVNGDPDNRKQHRINVLGSKPSLHHYGEAGNRHLRREDV